MPRDGSGVYSKPSASFVPNTTITSAAVNADFDDLVNDANYARPITAGGTGATNAGAAVAGLGAISKAEMSFPTAGGSANALTLTPATPLAALTSNQVYTFAVAAANTGAATLAVSGLAAKAIRRIQGGTDIDLSAGDLQVGERITVVYDAAANGSAGAWVIATKIPPTVTPGIRNKLHNPNFAINQRGVSGTVTLAAGAYGHDRWKAGASGCTYTFTWSNGYTTLAISAGSLQQVIESANLYSGTHVLSWAGSAQGKIGAGAYGASGITATVTAGSNLTVEFGVGSVAIPQLEVGAVASPFEQRSIQQELALCQRYLFALGGEDVQAPVASASVTNTGFALALLVLPVNMMAKPTLIPVGSWGLLNASTYKAATLTLTSPTSKSVWIVATASGLTFGQSMPLAANSDINARIYLSAEP